MDESTIIFLRETGLSTLALNRPGKANALTAEMMLQLGAAIAEAGEDDVLVLRSKSPSIFCAGGDIAEFSEGEVRLAAQEHALLKLIESMACAKAPLIAIARGRASGAGVILLCLADVVIAADDLQLACPEIHFGIYPVIVDAILQSRMSPALAARLCMGGQSIDAQDAYRIGLLTEVLPCSGFENAAEDRLQFYLEQRTALQIARRNRLRSQPPELLIGRVHEVTPLLAQNFRAAGVRQKIRAYLEALSRRKRTSPTHSDTE
jgi:methylglutaconyl-CoA hydratase